MHCYLGHRAKREDHVTQSLCRIPLLLHHLLMFATTANHRTS